MISWDAPIVIVIIGFVGGIFGGLIVNFVTIKLQKREEKITEEEKTKTDFSKRVKSILNEIIESWDKESTSRNVDMERLKNDFDIFSRQLTSLISSAPSDFPSEYLSQLRELTLSIKKLEDTPVGIGQDLVFEFFSQVEETVDLTRKIRTSFSHF